jgi:hypothetical protein
VCQAQTWKELGPSEKYKGTYLYHIREGKREGEEKRREIQTLRK